MFRPTSLDDLEYLKYNIYGPPGKGKTFVGMSISKKWNSLVGPIHIDDVIHIGFDSDALVGLLEYGITVENHLPAIDVFRENKFPIAMRKLKSAIVERVAQGGITAIVHDTITSLDKISTAWYVSGDGIPMSRTGQPDTMGGWGRHKLMHGDYHHTMMSIPNVAHVFLFHEQALTDDSDLKKDADKAKKRIEQLGDSAVLVSPQVQGKGGSYYTVDSSMEVAITAKKSPKTGVLTRSLNPAVTREGHRTKNRFQKYFNKPVEPNLRKLIQTIKQGCENPKGE